MNKVILMGRLTRNPDIRVSQNDSASKIARFTIAVDRRFQKFVVTGRIQTGSYTKQDGTKVYTKDVVVEEVEFAESKSSSASGAEAAGRPNPANAVEGFMNIDDSVEDEGMPFN